MISLYCRHAFLSVLITVFSFAASAQGDLLITPKRIVFDGAKKVEEINLANIGKDTATYSISFVQYKMDEDGKFEPVTEDDSTMRFAHKNLRFFPRTVTLAPNEAQSVKVQVIKGNELTAGEYRSHLFFRSMPGKKPLGEEDSSKAKADTSISIKITPVFGISIPVIIRTGETSVTSSFSDAKFSLEKQTEPVLNISLTRSGNISSYGDISVSYIGADNKITQVAYMKGLAVYLPNARRKLHIALAKVPGVDYHSGRLKIVYTDQSPRPQLLCETVLEL
ncbi:MAG: hypothetical protein QM687_17385 [Ferruginibacter sp.]